MSNLLRWPGFRWPEGEAFTPLADVEETDKSYIVELELAGVEKDNISIEASGRRVVVTGERREPERTGIIRERNRAVGSLRYEVMLRAISLSAPRGEVQ